tara:strand:+ start:123 stop:425 length:303 start_codon:yes stop_codon:yes gene_type:complete
MAEILCANEKVNNLLPTMSKNNSGLGVSSKPLFLYPTLVSPFPPFLVFSPTSHLKPTLFPTPNNFRSLLHPQPENLSYAHVTHKAWGNIKSPLDNLSPNG